MHLHCISGFPTFLVAWSLNRYLGCFATSNKRFEDSTAKTSAMNRTWRVLWAHTVGMSGCCKDLRKCLNLTNYKGILRPYEMGILRLVATSTQWPMIVSLKWSYFNNENLKKNIDFVETIHSLKKMFQGLLCN